MGMRRTSLSLICPLLLAIGGTTAVAQEGGQPTENTGAEGEAAAGDEKAKKAAEAAGESAEKAEESAEKAEESAEKAEESAEAAKGDAADAKESAEAAAAAARTAPEAAPEAAAAEAAAAESEAAAANAEAAAANADAAAAEAEAAAAEAAAAEAAQATAAVAAGADDDEIGVPWPSVYLGLSAGGHFVLTDWDFSEIDGEGRPVSPESSFLGKLRIGFQAAEWLALEGSVGYFPFKASTETNPGWLYEIDGLFFLKNAPWSGFVVVGAGLYHNAAPDLVEDEADIDVHLGLGTKLRLGHYVWLRGEVRYHFADSLDPDLPFGSNLEATLGLDFMLGGPDPKPEDTDGDGIIDPDDQCPTVPGLVETAGCPDRDRDGIVDAEDACPDAAGPPENKGCPDRDGDGILDKDDKCPDTKGVPEEQGCPPSIKDKDGDGIPDDKDVCPEQPEDMDGIEDANGCPEDDADKDGILDAVDKCPLKAETKNNFEEDDGCPDEAPKVVVTCERVELNESVYFDLAKYSIQARSFGLLDQVAQALQDNPHIKQVRVEGHTDNQGNDGFNMTLSNNRAREVRVYLIKKGVDEKRLTSKGYGETRPIATNDTEQGRAQNRRVDFVITDQEKREGCE